MQIFKRAPVTTRAGDVVKCRFVNADIVLDRIVMRQLLDQNVDLPYALARVMRRIADHPAVVLDWATRRVLSWRLSITMEAAFRVETLEDALARHGKPGIFQTDPGCA